MITQPDKNETRNDSQPVVHRTVKIDLQQDFSVTMAIGNPKVDIRMMPALHTHRSFITSNSCLKCKSHNYNPLLSNTS
jgi:hypothetical protein